MGVNSLPKTVTRQHRGCDLNPGPSAPESSTLTTRLPSHPLMHYGVGMGCLVIGDSCDPSAVSMWVCVAAGGGGGSMLPDVRWGRSLCDGIALSHVVVHAVRCSLCAASRDKSSRNFLKALLFIPFLQANTSSELCTLPKPRGKSGPALGGTEYRLMPSACRLIVRAKL